MKSCALTLCLIAVYLCELVWSRSIYDIISTDKELSEFFTLLQRSDGATFMLTSQPVTIFAPTNDALNRYQGSVNKDGLWNYHVAKSAITSDMFPVSLPSETVGSLPIWINKQDSSRSGTKIEYFVNQGRILRIDIKGKSSNGHDQVLHVIDQVLEPTLSASGTYSFNNPSAYTLLKNPQEYGINEQLDTYARRVDNFNKQMVLQGGNGHTFFLPVDRNTNREIWDRVDNVVIEGHIIPNQVYFTTAFPSYGQPSLAFNSQNKILLSMKNESKAYDRNYDLIAQSNTVLGYTAYPKGTVLARIIKANIPVKNGVVHLIENPLIVSNMNILQLVQQNSQLKEFAVQLQKMGHELMNILNSGSDLTLFAPSDTAFKNVATGRLSLITDDEIKSRQMLRLHVVPQRITTESIIQGSIGVVNTLDENRKLHFSHTMHNMTVVGGGVNATIVISDIVATNGIVHIIDKIMGIPYRSIYDKLANDRSLSSTFTLGEQENFNEQFQDINKRFTYFVPHNDAWNNVKSDYPSEYYKLFGGKNFFHVKKLLQRNLIVNKALSIRKLLEMKQIQMLEGVFGFTESGGHVYVTWEGEISEVIDPDVETTNGKVHILRKVLFKRSDLTGGSALASPFLSLLTLMLSALLVKFIV